MSKTNKKKTKVGANVLPNPADISITVNPEFPKPQNLDELLQDGIKKSETFCERIMREKRERDKAISQDRLGRLQEFLNRFELIAHEDPDHVYELGGRHWRVLCVIGGWYYLENCDTYHGFPIMRSSCIYDTEGLANLLVYIDQEEAKLRKIYPNNIWGKIKAKIYRFLF